MLGQQTIKPFNRANHSTPERLLRSFAGCVLHEDLDFVHTKPGTAEAQRKVSII